MTKELEALKTIKIKCHPNSNPSPLVDECLEVIEQSLQRLEAIDNSNPNKALEILYNNAKLDTDRIEKGGIVTYAEEIEHNERIKPYYDTIKQALIKSQEQEKENCEGGRLPNKEILYLKQSIEQCNDKPIFYMSRSFGNKYIVPQKLFEEQDKVLEIIKEKCLYKDNLNWVAVCIDYDMYKEKMSEKHDTKVVKIDWNDKSLLDCIRLLTKEEFIILKRYCNGNNL